MYESIKEDYPLLSPEDTLSWFNKYQEEVSRGILQGEAFETLMLSNMGLVYGIAYKYAKFDYSKVDDLIQEGSIGLIRAIEKYKPQLGYAFSTYATWWIRQSITRFINSNQSSIRVSEHSLAFVTSLRKKIDELTQLLGRTVTESDILEFTEITEEEYRSYIQNEKLLSVGSLDTPLLEDSDRSIKDTIVDDSVTTVDDVMSAEVIEDALNKALDLLNYREEYCIREYYGLGGKTPRTYLSIAQEFGVTKKYIRQVIQKATYKLKSPRYKKVLSEGLKGIDNYG